MKAKTSLFEKVPVLVFGISLSGILFGFLTVFLHVFNYPLEILADRLSSVRKCVSCTPATFEILNTYVGIIAILFSLLFLLNYFYKQKLGSFFEKNYLKIIVAVIGFLCLLIFLVAFNRYFDRDEFEHIHATWYVMNNSIPYVDFFEHHHPLLWYAIAPFLSVFGYSAKTLIILRIAMFLATLCIALLTYLIAKDITTSRETSLLSVLLLLSMVMFVNSSIEIRPDVPQVLFGLISIYYLILFFRGDKNRHLIFAGFAASLSFLFLQKSVFLLIAYCVIFLFQLIKRKISLKAIFYFSIAFLLPLCFVLLVLMVSELFRDYLLTNWIFNINRARAISPLDAFKISLINNTIFWLLSFFSIISIAINREGKRGLRIVTFIGLVMLSSLFIVKNAYRQYFMFAIPLLCINAGHFIKNGFEKIKLHEKYRLAIIFVILFVPVSFFFMGILQFNHLQLEKIEYVMKNSEDTDFVYDGDARFNLFRKDLHYYWFNATKDIVDTFNEMTDNRYGEYDVCALVKSKKPIFISDFGLNITECGFHDMYAKTQFDGLYIKKHSKSFR